MTVSFLHFCSDEMYLVKNIVPYMLGSDSMTFWRLCSGILRSHNFILWVAIKMAKHPENTVHLHVWLHGGMYSYKVAMCLFYILLM